MVKGVKVEARTQGGWFALWDPSPCPKGMRLILTGNSPCAWEWGQAEGWPLSPWGRDVRGWALRAGVKCHMTYASSPGLSRASVSSFEIMVLSCT